MASKYGEMAVYSARLIAENNWAPEDAWSQAGRKFYPGKVPSQNKACPKGAFLGLSQHGMVKGVRTGQYLDGDNENMDHVVQLVGHLRQNPMDLELRSKSEIWRNAGFDIRHNNQVDIVLALHKQRFLEI